MARPLIKICGTTSAGDAHLAADAGADYLGVIIDHAPSPRNVSLADARAIFEATSLPTVAVTVNRDLDYLLHLCAELSPAAVQLHGDESAELVAALSERGNAVWVVCSGTREHARSRALEMTAAGAAAILIDARAIQNGETIYGGTGHHGDWELARALSDAGIRIILAGGLDAQSVANAIEAVNPWMVDTVSGVEAAKGTKDLEKVKAFVAAVEALS